MGAVNEGKPVNLRMVWVKLEGGPASGLSQVYELGWPPPDTITVVEPIPGVRAVGHDPDGSNPYVQVSRSQVTDEQAAEMPGVQRGALYQWEGDDA